jgi:hypothetical protein
VQKIATDVDDAEIGGPLTQDDSALGWHHVAAPSRDEALVTD